MSKAEPPCPGAAAGSDSLPPKPKPPPIDRHLSTVGIGEVFLVPPPAETLYLCTTSESLSATTATGKLGAKGAVQTWEIVGTLKSSPEDFVVREIGGFVRPKQQKQKQKPAEEGDGDDDGRAVDNTFKARVADITDAETLPDWPPPKQTTKDSSGEGGEDTRTSMSTSTPADKVGIDETTNGTQRAKHAADGETGRNDAAPGANASVSPLITQDGKVDKREAELRPHSPAEAVDLILRESGRGGSKPGFDAGNMLDSIKALQSKAVREIDAMLEASVVARKEVDVKPCPNAVETMSRSEAAVSETAAPNLIWIPQVLNDIPIRDPVHGTSGRGGSRGTFHRCLKLAFPLLQSSTLTEAESRERTATMMMARGDGQDCERDEDVATSNAAYEAGGEKPDDSRWIKIGVDQTYFGLIPSLMCPTEDLLALYVFRNKGCPGFDDTDAGRRNIGGGKRHNKRGKGRHHSQTRDARSDNSRGDTSPEEHEVLLRLLPDLSKDRRREIHRLISTSCRDLETGTRNGVSIVHPVGDEKDKPTATATSTTAIVVRWSQHAKRIASRKRKRESDIAEGSSGQSLARPKERHNTTLCVLRKRQTEHLAAINHLVSALRVRQSDIGLAGMKDMCAVTYQFCTLRNVHPKRARNCNSYLLSRGMQLGNFERVSFQLNQGDLVGNKFEIIVRDLKRVELQPTKSKNSEENAPHSFVEVFCPCDEAHVNAMAQRVKEKGFINYYGEQRVGDAGSESFVGVRPFDIGKAMLKNDFKKAVDLLMTGRSKGRGGEFAESPEVRKARSMWNESGGDPDKVLKLIPRGNSMERERTVLKGLKRYGASDHLAAMRCLHHGVRMFWINAYQSMCWNKMATERIKRLGTSVVPGDLYIESNSLNRDVRIATADTAGLIEFSSVVLPLPGHDVQYPANEIGTLYKSMLDGDGVEFRKDAIPEATAKGAYRHLVAFATSLDWEVVDTKADGSALAAKFSFNLGSGSYATMCLRELMVSTMAR